TLSATPAPMRRPSTPRPCSRTSRNLRTTRGSTSCVRSGASIPACRARRTSTPRIGSSHVTWSPAPAASTTSTSTETGPTDRIRVLIGGIGYRNLRDGSVGLHVIERLDDRAGDGIEVEDVSYHPVGLSQNLQDRPDYDRLVLVAAVARGRSPGTISAYRWDGV